MEGQKLEDEVLALAGGRPRMAPAEELPELTGRAMARERRPRDVHER